MKVCDFMDSENIYRRARIRCSMNRCRAAELNAVSERSLAEYERGLRRPPDEVVALMVVNYSALWLGYEHLRMSPLGMMILPELKTDSVASTCIKGKIAVNEFEKCMDVIFPMGIDDKIDLAEAKMIYTLSPQIRKILDAVFSVLMLEGRNEIGAKEYQKTS